MGASILLVEDEVALARALSFVLRNAGYDVRYAGDGLQALELFRRGPVDLVLLDLMLPIIDGRRVCRVIRRQSQVPVLILTARADEQDRVSLFELGADDYLTKPCGMRELLARVRALLRRSTERRDGDETIVLGDLTIEPRCGRAELGDRELRLRRREFELLLFLARQPGRVFSRQELQERVWGYEFYCESRTVDAHVRLLRLKLEADPSHPARLQTVRGVGYKLV